MKLRTVAVAAVVGLAGTLIAAAAVIITLVSYLGAMNPLNVNVAPAALACGQPGTTIQNASVVKAPAGFSARQVQNATIIVQTGQKLGVPPRGWVIAVAASIQEDDLHNSTVSNDHDSLGLFQERPSMGWGTPAQVTDPVYASTQFYNRLVKVPNWQSMPLTAAAQAVERSAFPNAYAKHEGPAGQLVDAITGGATHAVTVSGTCATPGQVTAGGWTQPVVAQIGSPYGPRGGRLHAGVDLMAAKHTPIRAAADGVVVESHCDASTSAVWSCDRDGQLDDHHNGITPGCGWMVDIRHAGGIETRYCHMVVQPLVAVGQHVAAGQQIGWSGSSGNSSGPHVHFEVHTGLSSSDRAGNANSTDPVPFMAAHGAPLGKTSNA